MCTHANPITNVASKSRISQKIRTSVNTPMVRGKKTFINDDERLSFMEMSMYRIRKYFKS